MTIELKMKKLYSKLFIIIRLSLFCAFLTIPSLVFAQAAAERATRETDILSNQQKIQEKLLNVPKKQAEPKLKEPPVAKEGEKKFFIKRINLIGCEFFSEGSFRNIVEKYENKEVSISQLQALAKEIEREYLRRGVISAVFIPQQEIKDETVNLQVVEAKMGELKVADAKYFNSKRLHYYWDVPRGTIMHYNKISQGIQKMNKNPDRQVKASLFAGTKPGTTDILLTPVTNFPIHATYTFDNEGVASSGKRRVGYGIRDNNFTGHDDIFLAGTSFGRSFSGTYFYHTLPITYDGTNILYGYSNSASKPLKEFSGTGLKSDAVTATFSLRQDLYSQSDYLGEVYFQFDAKDKTVRTNSGPLNRDRHRTISLGSNLYFRKVGSSTSFSGEYTQGLAAFGASSHNNPLASRGSLPVFQILNLGAQHKRVLPFNWQGNFRLKGQFAGRKLASQDEFGLGGIDSVRGYPASDFLADCAVFTSTEILIPAYFIPDNWKLPYAEATLKDQTTFVTFADYGWGGRRGALQSEKGEANLLGLGAGVRFSLFNQAFIRMEWGFPMGANNPSTEGGRGRFHFSVDFQDKLPEEIERIKQIMEEEDIQRFSWAVVNEELSRPESELAYKFRGYLYLAKKSYDEGNLEVARAYYEKINLLGASLYQQADAYVREALGKKKELKSLLPIARKDFQEGNLEQAKEIWQKIIDNSNLKQLTFEF